MLTTSALNHGVTKSLPHYFGICIGFPIMVTVVGFGMGAIFIKYPSTFFFLKICGILYLCFLAWKIANAGNPQASEATKSPFTFVQAAAFQWLNPKAWVIAISALAAFSSQTNFALSVVSVIAMYFLTGLISMALWLMFGHSLKHFLNTANRVKYFNISMAIVLVLSIIPISFTSISNVT